MSKQIDYAKTPKFMSYRARQNRKYNKGNRKFRLFDFVYVGILIFTIGTFLNSARVQIKYIQIPPVAHAQQMNFAIQQYPFDKVIPSPTPKAIIVGDRAKRLQAFFSDKGSPLADYAQRFVDDADKYGIDYTLMPAISCKESSCGLALPDGSHNPFGLGGSNFMWFGSWEDAIDFEAQLLSSDYRGQMVEAIGSKYCPASDNCAPNWAEVVTATQFEIIK